MNRIFIEQFGMQTMMPSRRILILEWYCAYQDLKVRAWQSPAMSEKTSSPLCSQKPRRQAAKKKHKSLVPWPQVLQKKTGRFCGEIPHFRWWKSKTSRYYQQYPLFKGPHRCPAQSEASGVSNFDPTNGIIMGLLDNDIMGWEWDNCNPSPIEIYEMGLSDIFGMMF